MNSSMLGTGRNWTRRSIEEIGYDIFNRLYKPGGGKSAQVTWPLILSYKRNDDDPRPYSEGPGGGWIRHGAERTSSCLMQEFYYQERNVECEGLYVSPDSRLMASNINLGLKPDILPAEQTCYPDYLPVMYSPAVLPNPDPGSTLSPYNGTLSSDYASAPTLDSMIRVESTIGDVYDVGTFPVQDSSTVKLYMLFNVLESGQQRRIPKWFEVYYDLQNSLDLILSGSDMSEMAYTFNGSTHNRIQMSPYVDTDPPYYGVIYYKWELSMELGYAPIPNWAYIQDVLCHATSFLASRYNDLSLLSPERFVFLRQGNLKDLFDIDYTPEKIMFP